MARYIRSLTVAVPVSCLHQQLADTLQSCDFQILYTTEGYLIARETPGNIPFAKLVTVEVLIDSTRATDAKTHLNFVIKNEELPLQANNHCFQMYQRVNQALADNENWQLVDITELETS
jgi:hypothetical protein